MKYIVTFLSGALVGAITALLFAPSSGEELRTQLGERAEAELRRAEAEWRRGMTELNAKLEDVLQEVRTLVQQSEELEAPDATDVEAEVEAEPEPELAT